VTPFVVNWLSFLVRFSRTGVTAAISSLMLLALKIQGSGSVGAKDLAPLLICEGEGIDLMDGLKITHGHGVVRSQHHTVCAHDLD
jgi:hypothetical protein